MAFLDTLKNAAENVATLTITTAVGGAVPVADKPGRYTPADNSEIMYSSIDLLTGDITSIISPSFLTPQQATIRQYHQAREDMGRDIIKQNIECLEKLADLVVKLGGNDQPASNTPS